jgi:two-component system chemotaxis response regulator CheY
MEIRRVMEGLAFDVQEADNGQTALTRLQEGEVSLALVDWNMPVMNGLPLIQRLEKDGRLKSMKVLMVTTRGELEDMIQALEQGANDYLVKPFSRADLVEKLEELGFRVSQPARGRAHCTYSADRRLENLPQPHRLRPHEGVALGGDLPHGAGAALGCVRVGGTVEDSALV